MKPELTNVHSRIIENQNSSRPETSNSSNDIAKRKSQENLRRSQEKLVDSNTNDTERKKKDSPPPKSMVEEGNTKIAEVLLKRGIPMDPESEQKLKDLTGDSDNDKLDNAKNSLSKRALSDESKEIISKQLHNHTSQVDSGNSSDMNSSSKKVDEVPFIELTKPKQPELTSDELTKEIDALSPDKSLDSIKKISSKLINLWRATRKEGIAKYNSSLALIGPKELHGHRFLEYRVNRVWKEITMSQQLFEASTSSTEKENAISTLKAHLKTIHESIQLCKRLNRSLVSFVEHKQKDVEKQGGPFLNDLASINTVIWDSKNPLDTDLRKLVDHADALYQDRLKGSGSLEDLAKMEQEFAKLTIDSLDKSSDKQIHEVVTGRINQWQTARDGRKKYGGGLVRSNPRDVSNILLLAQMGNEACDQINALCEQLNNSSQRLETISSLKEGLSTLSEQTQDSKKQNEQLASLAEHWKEFDKKYGVHFRDAICLINRAIITFHNRCDGNLSDPALQEVVESSKDLYTAMVESDTSAHDISYPPRMFIGNGLAKPTPIEKLYRVEQNAIKLTLTPQERATYENFLQRIEPYDEKVSYLQYYGDSTKWQMTLMPLTQEPQINYKQFIDSYPHKRQAALRDCAKGGLASKEFLEKICPQADSFVDRLAAEKGTTVEQFIEQRERFRKHYPPRVED